MPLHTIGLAGARTMEHACVRDVAQTRQLHFHIRAYVLPCAHALQYSAVRIIYVSVSGSEVDKATGYVHIHDLAGVDMCGRLI